MCVSRYSEHPRTCRNSQMNPSSDTRDFGIFWPTVGDTRDTHTKPKTLSTHIHDTEFAHSHAPVGGRTSILAEETHKNFKNEKRDTLCARREVGGVQRWRGRPEAVARWLGGPTPPPLQSTPTPELVSIESGGAHTLGDESVGDNKRLQCKKNKTLL